MSVPEAAAEVIQPSSPDRRLDGGMAWVGVAVGLVALYLAYWWFGEGSGIQRGWASRLAMVPLLVIAAGLGIRTARHPGLDRRTQSAWCALAMVPLLLLLGTGIAAVHQHQHTNFEQAGALDAVSDVAYLLCFPVMLFAIARLPHARRSRLERMTMGLDGAVVLVAGGIIVWYYTTQPAILQRVPDLWLTITSLGYPVGDMILLAAVSSAWIRRLPGQGRILSLFGLGIGCNFVGDLAFAYQNHVGTYFPGGLTDAAWMIGYTTMAFMAVRQHAEAVRGRVVASDPAGAPPSVSVVPLVAVGLSYGLLVYAALDYDTQPLTGLVLGAGALVGLLLARQVLAVRDNLRLLAERSARQSEARFRALVLHASDVIAIADVDTTLRYVSPAASRVLGEEPETLVGTRLLDRIHPEDVPATLGFFAEVSATAEGPVSGAWRLRHRDGTWLSVENSGTNLLDEPTVQGVVLNTRDVTERWALEEQLMHQAFHDPLTGLANRALFLDRVRHAIHRAPRRQYAVSVCFIDLDNFKTVNDSLGHATGDRLLVEAATRLERCVRVGDTIARLGGDEFAVLVEEAEHLPAVVQVAERVTEALAQPFALDGKEVFVSASIGIASRVDLESPDELLRNADVAMYIAKTRGKGRYVLFEPHMHAAALERLELEADLRRAVEREEFRLHYQPIVQLGNGRIVGVEALLRWEHPTRGDVPPSIFVPIAEETGLIVPLGRWVLLEACRQARAWQTDPGLEASGITMTVNISGRHLQDPALIDDVETAVAATGLDPHTLVLEITESMLMEYADLTLKKLRRLCGAGVALAIDDFGTGYSSLSYLQRFPVDILKIDKSFVDAMGGKTDGPVLARAIVALGDTMRLRTVAEGIETVEQAEALRALGCTLGQVFLYARPLPPGEVGERLTLQTGWSAPRQIGRAHV